MEAFIKLIERYEAITLEEIREAFEKARHPANCLTGFGDPHTCTLCIFYYTHLCEECPWVKLTCEKCGIGANAYSYKKISFALAPEELLAAYRARAKYMRSVLAPYLKK